MALLQIRQVLQQPQAQVGRHLIVAAAPGVQFAGRRADQLAQAALHGAVDVFVALLEFKVLRVELLRHGLQAGADLAGLGVGQHAGLLQGMRPGQAAAHVCLRQAPVEAAASGSSPRRRDPAWRKNGHPTVSSSLPGTQSRLKRE